MVRRKQKKIIEIVGTGTIGEPLIHLLASQKTSIGVDEILFHKRTPLLEEYGKVQDMIAAGARLVVDKEKKEAFKEIGLEPSYDWGEGLRIANVVIDCTPQGNDLKAKHYLQSCSQNHTKGFIAQGSEENFGTPYAWTINDSALDPEKDRFIQVVSCNAHQLVCIINTLVVAHESISNMKYGNFFIARRGSDVSEDKGTPGVEAEPAKTKYQPYGTHQAYDAARIFKTLYPELLTIPIHSQILKLSTQYMHTMCFDIEVKSPTHYQEALERLKGNPLIVFTKLKSTNRVFARARDASKIHGRILNQTVFYEPSLEISEDGTRIRGTCFTPQDGNALLSSVAAALWLIDPKTYKEKIKVFDKFLFKTV